jgi:serine/threonine-protein kinase HipA
MSIVENIAVCPGTLAEGFSTYSSKCRRELFYGKRVSHILSFPSPRQEGEQKKLFTENKTRISISGVQEKYSLKLEGKNLVLTDRGGEYILKPIPVDLMYVDDVPANEHLTMQIAAQLYKLPVAKNALIFFNDGVPAYITKRFDVKADGNRCLKEDFASLAQVTTKITGKNYKYEYTYEGVANLIDQYIPASFKMKELFFQLVVFNYLFSNGDAHLKNFSRIDCKGEGDAFLAPAYDLINTRIHVDDSDLALTGGLYEKDYSYPSFKHYGFYAFDDFFEFGQRIGLIPARIKRIIIALLQKENEVPLMVKRSFLSEGNKKRYLDLYADKHKRLSTSLQNLLIAMQD